MSPREAAERLADMVHAIERIQAYATDADSGNGYDPKTFDALCFCFVILGEAAAHLPREVQEQAPEIPWQQVIDMRHFSAHQYWRLDPTVIHRTILDDIPPLLAALDRLRQNLDDRLPERQDP
jgi:uncharacterized protein with HEPN domain